MVAFRQTRFHITLYTYHDSLHLKIYNNFDPNLNELLTTSGKNFLTHLIHGKKHTYKWHSNIQTYKTYQT